jgi:hypothetical protein
MMELLELAPDHLGDDLAKRIHKLLNSTWPEDAPNEGDYYRTPGTPMAVIGTGRLLNLLRQSPGLHITLNAQVPANQ